MADDPFPQPTLPAMSADDLEKMLEFVDPVTRRKFLYQIGGAGAAVLAGSTLLNAAENPASTTVTASAGTTAAGGATLKINGKTLQIPNDPRITLLDALREHLHLTGSKKGCDHGQCGACTVLVNGQRVNSCLTLAVSVEGDEITTIEGLANGAELHPVQAAFIKHDGFQCGYCTPGQICSSVACISEGHTKTDAEIREWMSGNICRCGAYTNIVDAIREVAAAGKGAV